MDMVDRVAKAIAEASGFFDDGAVAGFRPIARAALQAMREPTNVMLDAAAAIDENQIVRDNPGGAWDATQKALWAAMIAAALGEKTDAPKLV